MRMRGAHGGDDGVLATMDMAADVEQLRLTPEPFDLAFIDAMVPHHQDAVTSQPVPMDAPMKDKHAEAH